MVRAQGGSQSGRAGRRAVSRHLQQLLRAARCNRRGRSSGAGWISRDHSTPPAMLRPPALRSGDARAGEGAPERRDGSARSIRRGGYSDRRARAELYPDFSRRVAVALLRRSPREGDCVERVPARRVPRPRSAGFRAARTTSADFGARALPSEGNRGNTRRGHAAVTRGRRGTRGAPRGMLRDGGSIRLRPRAFRGIESDRRESFDSGDRKGAAKGDHRRPQVLVPLADSLFLSVAAPDAYGGGAESADFAVDRQVG